MSTSDGTGPASPVPGDEQSRAHAKVRQQVAELVRTPREPALRRQVARSVRDRYHARTDRWVGTVAGHGTVETLVVEREIIVTRRTWEDEGARSYLEIRGLQRVPLDAPGIDDRIVLLRARDDLGADVEQLQQAHRVGVEGHRLAPERRGDALHLGHVPELVGQGARHGEQVPGVLVREHRVGRGQEHRLRVAAP